MENITHIVRAFAKEKEEKNVKNLSFLKQKPRASSSRFLTFTDSEELEKM